MSKGIDSQLMADRLSAEIRSQVRNIGSRNLLHDVLLGGIHVKRTKVNELDQFNK